MESNVKSKQSAYLSRCNIGLKHLHRTMGLQATDKRRCWRMTHLDRDGSKLDACGFTKAVAAAIHELECDSSVNEVTAATQRLQHTQCMICIVRFLQNGTCALNHGVDAHDDMNHTTAGQNSLQQGNEISMWCTGAGALRGQSKPWPSQWLVHIWTKIVFVTGKNGQARQGAAAAQLRTAVVSARSCQCFLEIRKQSPERLESRGNMCSSIRRALILQVSNRRLPGFPICGGCCLQELSGPSSSTVLPSD